jgi:hypothetical protein
LAEIIFLAVVPIWGLNAYVESEQLQSGDPKSGFFRKIFYHRLFGVIAGIFGIVGTILAIVFWFESKSEPDLTYYISPARTPILKKDSLENFSVTFHGAPVVGDLSSAQVQIWNQGKAPIRSEDILKPITISTPNGELIYQVTAKPSRQVIGMSILTTNNTSKLNVGWKILEHNDALQLQIIYGGGVDMPLMIDGVIVGQERLTQFTTEKHIFSSELFAVVLFLVILLVLETLFLYTMLRGSGVFDVGGAMTLVVGVIVAAGTAYIAMKVNQSWVALSAPPFGY